MFLEISQCSIRYGRDGGPRAASAAQQGHAEHEDGGPSAADTPGRAWRGERARQDRIDTSRGAVDAVSLTLDQGQVGVLIGPSGCGKTSLLRAVAGLETLHAGRITMQGRVLSDAQDGTHVAPEARRIGMVFQDYALFPHLSIADNVAFGLNHLPGAARRERVQAMLDLVGLAHTARRLPHQLSGGQQQRVALARALAPRPQLLLLDEPFSSLDVDLRERLAQEVRQILKAEGVTALVVTHDQFEAFALGDAIGVMNRGRLEQWATLTRCITARPPASWPSSSATACSPQPRSSNAPTVRACTRRWANSMTPRAARQPPPTPTATATCCCAPTTSCTTTTRR
jgi:ABC-type nitrate/sulfonate/bicarbonate transport system ATPase subunit